MGQWRQTGVERVTITLDSVQDHGAKGAGLVAGFEGHIVGPQLALTPEAPILKAELALKRLLEPPGPLAPGAEVPSWLQPWATLRSDCDPATAHLRVTVHARTCTDTSVFDPALTHRLLFRREFHGFGERPLNWLLANPIGGDTNDGPRPTLGKIRNISFAWGYGVVLITNLYTVRSADIATLSQFDGHPNHPDADHQLLEAARAAGRTVIACGGASHDFTPGRYTQVLQMLRNAGIPTYAVARHRSGDPLVTRDGRPLHPRTLPGPDTAVAVPFHSQ